MSVLLTTIGLGKSYGGVQAVRGVDLSVITGSIHSVIGPNGAGKTSLFNLISGAIRPTAGRIIFDNRDITTLPAQRRAPRPCSPPASSSRSRSSRAAG